MCPVSIKKTDATNHHSPGSLKVASLPCLDVYRTLSLVLDFNYFTRLHLRVHWNEYFLRPNNNFQQAKIWGLYFKKTANYLWIIPGPPPSRLCSVNLQSWVHYEYSCVCGTCNLWVYDHLIQMKQVFCTAGPGPPFPFLECSFTSLASLKPGCPESCTSPWQPSQGTTTLQYISRVANSQHPRAPHCYFQTITLTQSYLKTKQKKYPTPLRLMSSDRPSTMPPLHTIIYWFSTTRQLSDSSLWLSLLSIPGSATSCVT